MNAKIALQIEIRKEQLLSRAVRWTAKLGAVSVIGKTKPEALENLRHVLEHLAAHPTPALALGPNGAAVMAHAAERRPGDVCTAVLRPAARGPCYTQESLNGRTIAEAARERAAELGA